MPEISRFYGILIKMYYADHNPPHFHAEYGGSRAEYNINTLDVMSGKLPPRAHMLVCLWASIHQQELLANWERAQLAEKLKKIRPLR